MNTVGKLNRSTSIYLSPCLRRTSEACVHMQDAIGQELRI
jgi:hypothetical protein